MYKGKESEPGEYYAMLHADNAFRNYYLLSGTPATTSKFWTDVYRQLIRMQVTGPAPEPVKPSIETSPALVLDSSVCDEVA
jgi:hypothetical protein